MRGDYTLKPLEHDIHKRGVQLDELIESPLDKYLVKYRSHRIGMINLWLGSCRQLK